MSGNKADQVEGKFNNQKVLDYCKSKSMSHCEVSAKTGDGVEQMFRDLA